MSCSARLLALTVMICITPGAVFAQPAPEPMVAEAGLPQEKPSSEDATALRSELAELRDDVSALWSQLDQLAEGENPPPWAKSEHQGIDRRLERTLTLLERLSSRVETPVPRLDEPFTLITVSLSTLFLGFLAGRSLGRRSNRKDPRLRL